MAGGFPCIQGVGAYLPEEVLDNAWFERHLDTSDEWIVSRTGIHQRRRAAPEESSATMGARAAQAALAQAGWSPEDLDLIVVATVTPDTHCPSTACWIQGAIQAPRAFAFDVAAACSGFLYALSVGEQYLRSGAARRVLVVAADTMTRAIDYGDRATCVLFGDGAGAVALGVGGQDAPGRVLGTFLHADGSRGEMLQVPGGGVRAGPLTPARVEAGAHWLSMNGRETFKLAVRGFAQCCREALEAFDLGVEEVGCFIPHQANQRILQVVSADLQIPEDRTCSTIGRYGNMAAATVPVGLAEAAAAGQLRSGEHVLLAAFGGGLTWGSSVIRW